MQRLGVALVRFPDRVVIESPQGFDEYGNPDTSFADPDLLEVFGFLVTEGQLLLPRTVDEVTEGDRFRVRGRYLQASTVNDIRSPTGRKLWSVLVKEVPE